MEILDPAAVATFMMEHPGWVAAIVFAVVFLEALVAVGYVIPAATVLFSAGALAAAGTVSPLAAVAGAALGSMAGSWASFCFGARFSTRMHRLWPFSRHPSLLERNREFVRRHGGKSIVLGRFTKPLRPTVPAMAGMLGMPGRRFALFNASGALLWGTTYLGAGLALGLSADFSPAQAIQLSALLLAATLLLAVALAFRQKRQSARLQERESSTG